MIEANQIKAVRKELGFTQKQFAFRLEIPIGTLRKYEQDLTQDIPSSFLRRLWEQFQVNPLWILGGRGPMLLAAHGKVDDVGEFRQASESGLPKKHGPTVRRGDDERGSPALGYVLQEMSAEEEEKLFQPLKPDEIKLRDKLYSLFRTNEDFRHFCETAMYLRLKKY